ncbi:hypothetical protein D9M69_574740 [compost metagenome]
MAPAEIAGADRHAGRSQHESRFQEAAARGCGGRAAFEAAAPARDRLGRDRVEGAPARLPFAKRLAMARIGAEPGLERALVGRAPLRALAADEPVQHVLSQAQGFFGRWRREGHDVGIVLMGVDARAWSNPVMGRLISL